MSAADMIFVLFFGFIFEAGCAFGQHVLTSNGHLKTHNILDEELGGALPIPLPRNPFLSNITSDDLDTPFNNASVVPVDRSLSTSYYYFRVLCSTSSLTTTSAWVRIRQQ
jgi:hypothetical protein